MSDTATFYVIICRRLDMRILTIAFLALIGVFLAVGTATAGGDTASGVQNSATPASGSNTTSGTQNSATPQLQFFPPTAYGSPCSKSAPVVAWNGAGSGKGTYCITLPICATGQFLTTIADGNGNPSFTCVDPSTDTTAAATPSDSGSSSPSPTGSDASTSGTNSSSASAGTETPPILFLAVEPSQGTTLSGQYYPSYAFVGQQGGQPIAVTYPPYPPTFGSGPFGTTREFYFYETANMTFYSIVYDVGTGGTDGPQCFIQDVGGVVSCVPRSGPP
jgi:hypothetical protein